MLPLVDRQMIAKWMTLSGYFMTKCVFCQHFLNQSVWMSEIVQPPRFCGVLCISRSTCTYTYTATAEKQRNSASAAHVCAADALFLCGSWASCYKLLLSPNCCISHYQSTDSKHDNLTVDFRKLIETMLIVVNAELNSARIPSDLFSVSVLPFCLELCHVRPDRVPQN